jgi:hypothetical protein
MLKGLITAAVNKLVSVASGLSDGEAVCLLGLVGLVVWQGEEVDLSTRGQQHTDGCRAVRACRDPAVTCLIR